MVNAWLNIVHWLFGTKSYTSIPVNDLKLTKINNPLISYNTGDIIDQFKLHKRLNSLGLSSHYSRDDSWDVDKSNLQLNNFTKSYPTSTLVDINQTQTQSDIILIDDWHIKVDSKCIRNGSYCLDENIFNGGHGEIWRAFKLNKDDNETVNHNTSYILKRMSTRHRPDILRCAIREIYYGEMLSHVNRHMQRHLLFARYISYFVSSDGDYWLIFQDEGTSLQHNMYATVYSDHNAMLRPSLVWRNMRTTSAGEVTLKGILYQLLVSVAELHSLNITHRDLKPSNILLNVEENHRPRIIVADFSSAVSEDIMKPDFNLYAPYGPSVREETLLYAPPEVLLSIQSIDKATSDERTTEEEEKSGSSSVRDVNLHSTYEHSSSHQSVPNEIAYHVASPTSYDMWSVGVIFLELLLGTPEVFSLDDRSTNIITQRLRRKGIRDEQSIRNALLLSSLSDYCIYTAPADETTTTASGDDKSSDRLEAMQLEVVNNNEDSYCQQDASLDNAQLLLVQAGGGALHNTVDTNTCSITDRALIPATPSSSQSSQAMSYSFHEAYDYPISSHQKGYRAKYKGHTRVCGLEELSKAILRRDHLGRGFDSHWGLDLLSRLLKFDPMQRISATEALQHAYFTGPYISVYDSSEHATQRDMDIHDAELGNEEFVMLDNVRSSVTTVIMTPDKDEKVLNIALVVSDESDVISHLIAEEEEEDLQFLSSLFYEAYPILLHDGSTAIEHEHTQSALHCDRKINTNQHAIVDGILKHIDYKCPQCNRTFSGDYNACYKHVTSRKHATHCHYDTTSLPPCLSDYALQPLDAQSGWCDLQGTRQYVEDVHAMYYDDLGFKLFGVFDGHVGSSAAKFAAKHIYGVFHQQLHEYMHTGNVSLMHRDDVNVTHVKKVAQIQVALLITVNADIRWSEMIQLAGSDDIVIRTATTADDVPETPSDNVQQLHEVSVDMAMTFIRDAFLLTNKQLQLRTDRGEMTTSSGATATTVLLFRDYILVAHVGDSRVIACCGGDDVSSTSNNSSSQSRPIQLTLDHTPHSSAEAIAIEHRGGWIDRTGTVWRVNGQLAVTRSLGDVSLRHVLSAEPDVIVFKRTKSLNNHHTYNNGPLLSMYDFSDLHNNASFCAHYRQYAIAHNYAHEDQLLFIIMGSDGLWDVMSNSEASEFVCEYLLETLQHTLKQYEEERVLCTENDNNNSSACASVESMHTEGRLLPLDVFHEVSKLLAYEALVRGSSDNIGVCVIDLLYIDDDGEHIL